MKLAMQYDREQKFREFRRTVTQLEISKIIDFINPNDQKFLDELEEYNKQEFLELDIIYVDYVCDNVITFEEMCEKAKPLFLRVDKSYQEILNKKNSVDELYQEIINIKSSE